MKGVGSCYKADSEFTFSFSMSSNMQILVDSDEETNANVNCSNASRCIKAFLIFSTASSKQHKLNFEKIEMSHRKEQTDEQNYIFFAIVFVEAKKWENKENIYF